MRPDCCESCEALSVPNHHAVILEIVHGLSNERERPKPWHRKLSQGEAWARVYGTSGQSAEANCSRMLKGADAKASLAHHRKARLDAIRMDRDEFEAQTSVRSAAKVADITHFGEPDPAEWERLLEMVHRGVEDRNSTESTQYELLEEVGSEGDDAYCPPVVARIPAGRRKASAKQLSAQACRATQSYYMDPMDEWPQELRDALVGWQETKTGRLLAVFSQDANSRLYADVKGWKSITVDMRGAEAIVAEPVERVKAQVMPALEALAAGEAAAWVKARAAELVRRLPSGPERDQFEALASGATGSAVEVWACLGAEGW